MIKGMSKKKVRKQRLKGFTLVEMMVSVAVFALIVTMGITSLVTIMKSNQYAEERKKVTDTLDYVLENLTRELRLGKNYYFAPQGNESGNAQDGWGVINGGSFIGFDSSDNRGYMIYYLKEGEIVRKTYSRSGVFIEKLTNTSQVAIEEVHIRVMNTDKTDKKQPLVWLQITGHYPTANREFTVQTLVSQRELDV